MTRFLCLLLLSVSVSACSRADTADPGQPGHPETEAAGSDCDFTTTLVPGIPGSPGNLIASTRNPNGDSELAVLMRRFVTDLQAAKTSIEAGGSVAKLHPSHRKMRCVWHTVPGDRNEAYDRRAQGHLAVVKVFDAAPSRTTYNGIVANCIACHSVSCQGVIEFISTLKWD